jgi:mono/diheme cytochrome c family protein
MRTLISILLTLAAVAALGAALVYSGAVNFAADEPHSAAVFALIERARERSIEARIERLEPRAVDDALVAEGASHYGAMCEGCHLAPGMDDTDLRRGLYPQPPKLASPEYARATGEREATAARQFWIVKHGLKASGMPAWGITHDDETIWGIVAFLQRLPQLSPAEYDALTEGGNAHESHERSDEL